MTGVVQSDARDKTIRVVVSFLVKHPKYGKYIRRRTTLHAHDPQNEARVGDTVEVMECRPMSKQKSWRLLRVLNRVAQVEARG
jgi:small subunit ribosomal protein S17